MNIKKFIIVFATLTSWHIACFGEESLVNEERKTLIVTGASGELGGATARLLAKDYDLILTGRNISKLEALQGDLKAVHLGKYEICTLDYESKVSRESFKNTLLKASKPITGLVLITPRPKFPSPILTQEENVWLDALQSTFTGPLDVLKCTLPHMSSPSKIVVIAGTTSVQLSPQYGPSCIIRRMWTACVKALSHQLGPQGISINAVSPGVVLTSLHQDRIQKDARTNAISFDKQMEKDVANIPLRRHAEPKEVAKAIKFLITSESDFVDGVNLVLDGGLTLSY